ncbi:DUF4835 family protein [Taibaiella chishuiensis]|uniref:Uncharacterized protein DUF4835 n=1 Tax=Taibaiella chishuiensis TaxID=1434707 RepID=A0A2P8CR53_9BACT|nr:DUF4835 family protein [Taibaiella chishuiensis]PSK87443.1 uncharacterized protein DUF4835 [Taibaiella chishuiensis]
MRKFFFFLLLMAAVRLQAQELNCKVDVSFDRIQNVDPKVFQALKKSLNEFVNNRKWTNDNFKVSEKIDCTFFLNLTERTPNDNIYKGTLNIQASRPIFNSGYNSPTVNFIDREVVFRFDESQTLQYDDNRVAGSDALASNLTAIIAYYSYVILGLDYDSFSPKGGDEYFKRALNIVNNAPEEGKSIRGWKAAEGNRNRYWLIDQILSPRFDAFRPYWYRYHRLGLDVLSQKPEEGRKVILDGIPTLTKINNDNPTSILFQFFFNAKSTEYVNVLQQATKEERKDYIDQLSKMDVPNIPKYRGVK